jgi:hypothetical protein
MVNRKRLAKPQDKQPAPLASDGPGNRFLMLQTLMAAPIAHAEADGKDTPLGRVKDLAAIGSGDLYRALNPKDPVEAMLATLGVGLTNATRDCLCEAARTKHIPAVRDMNLKQGFSGAKVVVDVLEALERRRRQDPKAVTVGNVNVEAGGQAIVGHVESRGDPGASTTDTSPTLKPTDTEEAEE